LNQTAYSTARKYHYVFISSNLKPDDLAQVLSKLNEISRRQDDYQAQFLNSNISNTVTTHSAADEIILQ